METLNSQYELVRCAQLSSSRPDSEGGGVRVWRVKQNESIRVNWVEMKGKLALHVHPDAEHSLLVLEGRLRAQVGEEKIELQPGDYLSIPAGVPHKYWSLTPTSNLVSMDAPYYDPAKTIRLE